MNRLSLFFLCTCLLLGTFTVPRTADSETLPLRVQIVLTRAFPLLAEDKYQEAALLLTAFRDKGTGSDDDIYNHSEVVFTLGNCLFLQGKLREARKSYQYVVTREPSHLRAWQNLAKTDYELEDYLAAGQAFYTSYSLGLGSRLADPLYLYYSAVALLTAGEFSESLEKFELLLKNHPEAMGLEWKENLVYCFLQAERPEKALPFMVELAEGFTGKKQQRWQELLLQQYMALEMHDRALSLVKKLTRANPTVALWWKALAHINLQMGQYEKGLCALSIYSYLTPLNKEEHKLLANLFLQQGIPEKAIANYEQCDRENMDRRTILSLVRAYRSVDEQKAALEKLVEFAESLDQQSLELERGEIFYSIKNYSKAAIAFEKAAHAKGSRESWAYLMLGYSCWQQEKYQSAISAFSLAVKEKRYTKEAEKAINQLKNLTTSMAMTE